VIVDLVAGTVMHRRSHPVANAFRYPAFCLRIPLSRTAEESAIAWNRPGLVSFHERDHGPRDGSALDAWARAVLAGEGVACDGDIVLYAFPRMLGYVFNPVSFWVCHDARREVRAVIAEVNNTFGERHLYVLANDDGSSIADGQTLRARKAFHVSPFCEVKGEYRFRFHFGNVRWLARVDYFDDAASREPLLATSISGVVETFPRRAATLFWRYRWFTLGVVARIHWQAARLWLRRVPWIAKPAPPSLPVTRNS
jgi:DUF1365 family protein